MSKMPPKLGKDSIIPSLLKYLICQGKVRNTYQHPVRSDCLILQATNRISAFDIVFPFLVPCKGEVLTVLTDFARRNFLKDVPHHFVGSEKYPGYNAINDLQFYFPDIPIKTCVVVKKAKVMPYELIFRAHIGGSVWKEYLSHGTAGGVVLPKGLKKWAKLDYPLFTPSTKSADGHDQNIPSSQFFQETGEDGRVVEQMAFNVFHDAYSFYQKKGLLLLDTKMEVGYPAWQEKDSLKSWMIIDEILTPDSSRFVKEDDFNKTLAEGQEPDFFDKEVFRAWAKKIDTPFFDENGERIRGAHKLNPQNSDHMDFIWQLMPPQKVIYETRQRFLRLVLDITGMELEGYQNKYIF